MRIYLAVSKLTTHLKFGMGFLGKDAMSWEPPCRVLGSDERNSPENLAHGWTESNLSNRVRDVRDCASRIQKKL